MLASTAAATALAGTIVLTSTPASADPGCLTRANATVNSPRSKVTVTVTSNPCRREVRAWAECMNEAGRKWNKTSGAITSGSATADCGLGGYVTKKGHEINVSPQGWTRYVY
ncbi:hypothetical protein ACF1G0_22360 [Streptomyces sp. NPDC013953]|uniref:hypothetical protein n=1 Tax=Streptomyces sp. NPDC013953 TaxID=3364868 RepID=UPI003701910D